MPECGAVRRLALADEGDADGRGGDAAPPSDRLLGEPSEPPAVSSLHPRRLADRLPLVGLTPRAPIEPRTALRDSLPLAGVLLLWTVLSWLAIYDPFVAETVRTAGAVAALGYVVVRGVRRGRDAAALVDRDVASVVGQSLRIALAPAAWFLAAGLVPIVADLWNLLGIYGLFRSPAETIVRVCTLTGLGTALLVVIAGVVAALGGTGLSSPDAD